MDTIPIQVVNEGWRCAVCCGTAMRCQTLLGVPASLRFTSSKRNVVVFFHWNILNPILRPGSPGKTTRSKKKISGCATTYCVISMIIADSHTITRI